MSGLDPRRMKVTELRAELQRRGLESRGLKAELCDRLQEALDSELLGTEEEKGGGGGGCLAITEGDEEEEALELGDEEEDDEEEEEMLQEDDEDDVPQKETTALPQEGNNEQPKAGKEEQPSKGTTESTSSEVRKGSSRGAEGVKRGDVPPKEAVVPAKRGESLNGAAQKGDTGDMTTEEDGEEAESGAAEGGEKKEDGSESKCSEQHRPGSKRPREEEQHGRTYHEFKEEAYFSRSKSPSPPEETDVEVEESLLALDKYNSDLHFKMDKDRFGGKPLFYEKFPSLWSGSRATHGVTRGKVCFEIKVTQNLPQKKGSEETPLLRVGWSVVPSAPQLGEDDLSYAYDSRGLKVTSSRFEAYGQTFGENDVIGCFAILEGGLVKLSFAKNGVDLGQAFLFEKEKLGDQALLPHVLCKGCAFQVNFGQKEEPWHQPPDGFSFLQAMEPEDLVETQSTPKTTEKCEVLLMVGLPGVGKTSWAQKHIQENPEMHFQHLCTDKLLAQLKTTGPEAEEKEDLKAQDHLTQLATQCLIRLVPLAARRKGNYIIDQCTVYNSAQRRKLNCFKGFCRKAVLLVTSEEEWKKRVEQRKEKEGEIIPESVLLEMKANFSIPKKNEYLDEVLYPELGSEEAEALISAAKKEARQLLPSSDKRGNRPQKRNRSDRGRGGYQRAGNYQQRGFNNRAYMNPPRQQQYQQRQYWTPQRGGYQNYYDRYSPQQNRYYVQYPNYRQQNRGNWQYYEDRTPYWDYPEYRGYR
ncbi:heterogeneous nuclear ribonucleoprotein U-like protein 2 [Rhinophrynus dorsalis]